VESQDCANVYYWNNIQLIILRLSIQILPLAAERDYSNRRYHSHEESLETCQWGQNITL
jgi:hypothetical protein